MQTKFHSLKKADVQSDDPVFRCANAANGGKEPKDPAICSDAEICCYWRNMVREKIDVRCYDES